MLEEKKLIKMNYQKEYINKIKNIFKESIYFHSINLR